MAVIGDIRCLTSIRLFSSIQGVNRISLILLILFASWICATPNGCDNNSTKLEWLRDIDLPDRPTQGPICGTNSCCGQAGEMRLGIASKEQVEKFIKDSVSQVVSLLQTRSRHLESFFKEMMTKSKKEFHSMFERTYGMIYLQNSDVFTNFFVELEKYYNHGGVRLTETMDHFFTILYQRMFRVINAQYDFDEEYLSCVARDIAKMKPFGDVPMKLAVLLKRSFVATRIFHRALNKGAIIAEKMLKLNVSEECGEEVTRMQFCDYCTNQAGPGACNSYCTDTIKSCLYLFGELDKNWDKYIDGLDKVADKLLGPFNIEMVVEPINIKISEAIMNFQESGSEVSQKVFVECGAPTLKGENRRRRAVEEDSVELDGELTYTPIKFNGKKKHKKTNSMIKQSPMEKKITEVKQKIKETRNFWNHLPYQYCNNITTAAPTEDVTCWNGTALGTYNSPETKPIPSKPTILSEQLFALEVLVHKLKSAYQGQDEDLVDEEEEEVIMTSGSGSGDEELDKEEEFEEKETTSSSSTTTESIIIINSIDDDSPKVATGSAAELSKALIHYVLPIIMVWFGGAVSELL